METIIDFLKGTPTWVFFVFGYFLFSGIKALKPRVMSVKKLFILPLALVIMSLMSVDGQSVLLWLPTAFIAGWLGWKWMAKIPFKVDAENQTVAFPGSPFSLLLFLAIFAVRYFFGALQEVAPDEFLRWAPYQSVFSGMLTGLCCGRMFYIWQVFRKKAILP